MIASEFGYLKATELMLFFYRLKAGRYGHFYGSIDPMVIMDDIRKRFMPERALVIERAENEQRAEEERRQFFDHICFPFLARQACCRDLMQ